ncbi:thiamine pyrophosphate-binding protein [Mesorhizobium sp. M0130]
MPAFYCAPLFDAARQASDFRTVVTSSDLEAGYAADAYARVRGLSAVSVTYGVGTLSLINAIAGAYIERSPVMVINGGPSDGDIKTQNDTGILFSHSMGRPHSDLDAFRPFTAFCERVTDLANVPAKVDQAIVTALSRQHPVYLEMPRGLLANSNCPQPVGSLTPSVPSGTAVQAAHDTVVRVRAARKPLVIVGIEVQRYGLAAQALSIINKLNLRWTTTLLARSTLSERHPGFLGVFNGEEAPRSLLQAIDDADLIVALGTVFARGHRDIMLPKRRQTIRTWDGKVFFPGIAEQPAGFPHYVRALDQQAFLEPSSRAAEGQAQDEQDDSVDIGEEGEGDGHGDRGTVTAQPEVSAAPGTGPTPVPAGLTYKELFDTINEVAFLDASFAIIPDTFLGIYSAASAAQLRMPGQNCFISSALWASIGHSVGAAVGAAIPREKRPLVICGDGGFQMTAQALSTMARMNMNAIVVVVDNGLYGYEQWLLDPSYYDAGATNSPKPYAELSRWEYRDLASAIGVRLTAKADSTASLRTALANAKAFTAGPSLLHAIVQSRSLPPGL